MSKFTVLHLSDAHIGKAEADQLAVLDPLLKSIKKESEERHLSPSLIVFSGDLVQGCHLECREGCKNDSSPPEDCRLEKQYKKAEDFLNKIYTALSKKPGQIPLLIVPGNHDVNRHSINTDFFAARETYSKDSVIEKQREIHKKGWKDRLLPQKRWMEFSQNYPNHSSMKWNTEFNVPYGVINHGDIKIGVIGLNSCWAAGSKKEKNKLWIGREQYQILIQSIKETSFKIVSAHHPISWLHEEETKILNQRVDTEFNIFFHGHEHDNWFDPKQGHLKVGGGAIYEDSDKENGYNWLEIDFENKKAKIHLFDLSNSGSYTWIPRHIPTKTDEYGIGKIKNLWDEDSCSNADETVKTEVQQAPVTTLDSSKYRMKDSLVDVIRQFESMFNITWERHRFNENAEEKHIFWPVKLRKPTAIHASQCFIAAALQKKGCIINLYIDNFGPEYNVSGFLSQIKEWFQRVGGDPDKIVIKKYKDIVNQDKEKKREILETLLAEALSTIQVLKISKIYNENISPEDLINILDQKKPRRMLTPAMTWTCLKSLSEKEKGSSFITLGGYDEKILWDTWKTCIGETEILAGHLFLSELDGLHMENTDFSWRSRSDIERAFSNARKNDDSIDTSINSMIPWCINNCALIPSFVAEEEFLQISGYPCKTVAEVANKNLELDDPRLVAKIDKWVL
jgi:predicted MPP superfamily phosphohydrolase